MDFELNDDQQAILEAVGALTAQHAGAARAVALSARGEVDAELDAALTEAGFDAIALGKDTGAFEAALVVEAVARAGGLVSVGASALVAPVLAGRVVAGPVAFVVCGERAPVRFGAHARSALVVDGDVARLVSLDSGSARPVRSNFGYPMGRIPDAALAGGESLGAGSGERLRSWWRVAVALECVGSMDAALATTLDYVKRRHQFGRAIGSFQAVQHRLAECAVLVEGARWLAREAAARQAPEEAAALAAAHATAASAQLFNETHQLSGAMGFTHDHDLHVWSMRLPALRLELQGSAAHARGAAEARWGPERRVSS